MKKRIAALVLSLSIAAGAQSAFAASGFSDLNEFHAWAEPQIEEMTTLGIIKGYTDGTFRPDQSITKTEALVLIARVAGYISYNTDAFRNAAYERYSALVNSYQTLYPYEVSYLLYKGVLSESEVSAYISPDRASSPLLRYEIAELLTKLMRAESSLSSPSEISLSYSDSGEIPYDSFPYVDYVTNESLMQGVYDPEYPNDIFFKPYSPVTRAQMAVLLYRVLGKRDITVSYYDVVGKNADSGTITYRDGDKTSILRVPSEVNIFVDGYACGTVDPIYSGASMALFYINGDLCDLEVVNDYSHKYNGIPTSSDIVQTSPVSGAIEEISLSGDCVITVDGVPYVVSSAAAVYINSVVSTVYDLRVGQSVTLEFSSGRVISITASTSSLTDTSSTVSCMGTVTKIDTANRAIYLEVTNSETDAVSVKKLYLESGCIIVNAISGASIQLSELDPDCNIIASGTLKNSSFYASKIIVR